MAVLKNYQTCPLQVCLGWKYYWMICTFKYSIKCKAMQLMRRLKVIWTYFSRFKWSKLLHIHQKLNKICGKCICEEFCSLKKIERVFLLRLVFKFFMWWVFTWNFRWIASCFLKLEVKADKMYQLLEKFHILPEVNMFSKVLFKLDDILPRWAN